MNELGRLTKSEYASLIKKGVGLVAQGYSYAQASRMADISLTTLRRWCKLAGVKSQYTCTRLVGGILSPAEWQKIRADVLRKSDNDLVKMRMIKLNSNRG